MNDDLLTPVSPAPLPVVFVRDGGVFANSRDVAAYFGKQHKNVLRDIDNLGCSQEFTALNFEPSDYTDPTGRKLRSFDMTKDGFAFLVMGFTGAGAARFKESYIAQFNAMESTLRTQAPLDPMKVLNDPSVMRGLLLTYSEKVISLEAAVEAAKEKTGFYDRFLNADGVVILQNAARILGLKPNLFIRWLKTKYLFYRGKCLVPYTQYQQQGLFEVKPTIIDDKTREQTFITPKGLAYFSGIVPNDVRLHKNEVQ